MHSGQRLERTTHERRLNLGANTPQLLRDLIHVVNAFVGH
jgi:hypothetical protein